MNTKERTQNAKAILENPLWIEAKAEVEQWVKDKQIAHWQDKDALQVIAAFSYAHTKYINFLEEIIEYGQYEDFMQARTGDTP